jgi:hypothetical protein
MLAELDDPKAADVIADGVLYHVMDGSYAYERAGSLSRREREAVADFFEECAMRYDRADFLDAAERLRRWAEQPPATGDGGRPREGK